MEQRNSVEIQAVSVVEATRLALEQLAATHDDVDIEVLSDAGPDEDAEALVRVTRKGHASQPVPSGAAAAGGVPRRYGRDRGDRGERGGRHRSRGRGGQDGNGEQAGESGHWLAGRGRPGERPSQRGVPPRRVDRDRVEGPDERVAREVMSELLARMGVGAEVIAVDNPSIVPPDDEEPPTIYLEVIGRDLGMLIGRRGEHLSHVQFLASMLVNQRLEEWNRIIVDVEGYRTRREEFLVGLAERTARQASRSNRPIELEPMPPNERRIVHLTLREHPEVSTSSDGEGHQRRITVTPNS